MYDPTYWLAEEQALRAAVQSRDMQAIHEAVSEILWRGVLSDRLTLAGAILLGGDASDNCSRPFTRRLAVLLAMGEPTIIDRELRAALEPDQGSLLFLLASDACRGLAWLRGEHNEERR